MDLSPPAMFLYLLIVVVLYTAPIVVVVLVVAWRKGFFARALKGVVVGLPLIAVFVQASFYLDLQVFSMRLQSDKAFYKENFPQMTVYRGRVVGYKERNGFTYTRYQFEVDPFMPDVVEILMPPDNVNSIAMIELESPKPTVEGTEPAQLVVRRSGSYYNPTNKETPKAYFTKRYPSVAGYVTNDPLIILTLHGGNNNDVTMFNGLDAKYPWRHQPASVDF